MTKMMKNATNASSVARITHLTCAAVGSLLIKRSPISHRTNGVCVAARYDACPGADDAL